MTIYKEYGHHNIEIKVSFLGKEVSESFVFVEYNGMRREISQASHPFRCTCSACEFWQWVGDVVDEELDNDMVDDDF